MDATPATGKHLERTDAGIRHLFEELNREDSELRTQVLDTALAGLRLGRDANSPALRRDAAEVWSIIEPLISHHLRAEDDVMLPWLDRHAGLSSEVLDRLHQCHSKLRRLVSAIETVPFERATDAQAIEAARALCGLAVCLDDAIDAEERKIFPAIQKALFETDQGA